MRPRRVAAFALTVALALGVLGASRPGERARNPTGAIPTTTSPTATSTRLPSSTAAPIEASARPARSTPRPEGEDTVAVIRQALAAWGRFAVSRESSEIEPWFHRGGPQFQQLETEAGSVPLDGPAYRVTFEPLEVDPDEPARVRGRVVFVRTGEPSQTFDWWMVLRRIDGRLRVWTVEEASG